MRAYRVYGAKSFAKNLTYRSEVWLQIVGNFMLVLIQVSIWQAVLGEGAVNGIGVRRMVTYSILNAAIASMLMTGLFHRVDGDLKSGNIAVSLIRPLRYPLFLLAESAGDVAYRTAFTAVPTLLVCALVFGFEPPASAVHAAGFALALLLAVGLSLLIAYLVALLAFWFLTTFAMEWFLEALMIAFSGSFVPLWFFPPEWARLAQHLPFPFLGFVPAAVYMGEIPVQDLWRTLGTGLMWAVILAAATVWLGRRAMRRLFVQGG
jgi:ABC-2 type transport system permease protein